MRPASLRRPARLLRGIHLLELLAVLMLLAVLLALAWGPWQRALRYLQADALRSELVSSLVLARNTAIAQHRRISVCASAAGEGCGTDWEVGWQVQLEARTPATGEPPRVLRRYTPRHAHVRLLTSTHRPQVQFRSDGRNAGTNQTLRLCVDGYEHSRVVISVPGRIRSLRPRTPQRC